MFFVSEKIRSNKYKKTSSLFNLKALFVIVKIRFESTNGDTNAITETNKSNYVKRLKESALHKAKQRQSSKIGLFNLTASKRHPAIEFTVSLLKSFIISFNVHN